MLASLTALMLADQNAHRNAPAEEFRGVWIATVDNIDWPSKRGLSTADQRQELRSILHSAAALHLNAVLFQVRPAADTFYPSKLEPWSEYLSGVQGVGPNPRWDPLDFAIRESHALGLELHAWINPFRARHASAKGPLAPNHAANSMPDAVRAYGKQLWLDPGSPQARDHTLAVVEDLVTRYDIDGIHLDDYFYPYPIRSAGKYVPFPDSRGWLAYRGSKNHSQWRRANVDGFVHDLYRLVKKLKPWVKVGISPYGIYRPGTPAGIRSSVDSLQDLSADPVRWLKKGWCDYLSPQLYWQIDKPAQSFTTLLRWWNTQNPRGLAIYPGLFTSQIGEQFGNWPADEIIRQIYAARALGSKGAIHFSARALVHDFKHIRHALLEGPYQSAAKVPKLTKSRSPRAPL